MHFLLARMYILTDNILILLTYPERRMYRVNLSSIQQPMPDFFFLLYSFSEIHEESALIPHVTLYHLRLSFVRYGFQHVEIQSIPSQASLLSTLHPS